MSDHSTHFTVPEMPWKNRERAVVTGIDWSTPGGAPIVSRPESASSSFLLHTIDPREFLDVLQDSKQYHPPSVTYSWLEDRPPILRRLMWWAQERIWDVVERIGL
jgi:hypothetical protein